MEQRMSARYRRYHHSFTFVAVSALLFLLLHLHSVSSFQPVSLGRKWSARNRLSRSSRWRSFRAITSLSPGAGLDNLALRDSRAHIEVKSHIDVRCVVPPSGSTGDNKSLSLSRYMQLPTEQFTFVQMPMNSKIAKSPQGDDLYTLTIPPVKFMHLEVSPSILCRLTHTASSLTVRSVECLLGGRSDLDSINSCFEIAMSSTLTWTESEREKVLHCKSHIDARIDPPAPFKYAGRTILEKSGNVAMNLALKQIESAFAVAIARDYEKWASDEAFRANRFAQIAQLVRKRDPSMDADVDRILNELEVGEFSSDKHTAAHSHKDRVAELLVENKKLKNIIAQLETQMKGMQKLFTTL